MPLQKRSQPFDNPGWIFGLKYDGFRALAVIEPAGARLISRNGNPFSSSASLAEQIAAFLPSTKLTVLDGDIVCLLLKRGH